MEGLLKRTKVGLVMIIVPLTLLFCIFTLFTISHAVFLYYDFFQGEAVLSPVLALISILAFFPLFHIAWLAVIVGLILLATDARKYANMKRTIMCLLLWFLFIPAFYGFFYLILNLGIDIFELYFLMMIIIGVIVWITVPLFLPLMSMMGKRYLKRVLVFLPLCAVPALIFSFTQHSEDTLFSMLFMEVFYLFALASLVIGYMGFYKWVKCLPKGMDGEEILVHKYMYWHEEGRATPNQIITNSENEIITLTCRPVPKESLVPGRSFRVSVAAIALTIIYSVNCLFLKSSASWAGWLRRVGIPLLGLASMFLILIALCYSGWAVYNIKAGNWKENRSARIALILAVGASLFFLALTMSIGLYLL